MTISKIFHKDTVFTIDYTRAKSGELTGSCLELPIVLGDGTTVHELEARFREAIDAYYEAHPDKTSLIEEVDKRDDN